MYNEIILILYALGHNYSLSKMQFYVLKDIVKNSYFYWDAEVEFLTEEYVLLNRTKFCHACS